MRHVRLLVIGAGSGNTILDARLAGPDAVLVDAGEPFGGTCLNHGCIPTKMFVHVADVVRASHASELGLTGAPVGADWAAVRDRVFGRIDPIAFGGENYRRDTVTLVREPVRFVDDRVIETASGERFAAEEVVIAAGSRTRPLSADHDEDDVLTNETVMRLDQRPERLLILGGGAVAAEFAHVFDGFGTEVTLAIRGSALLGREDELVSERFTNLASERYALLRGASATAVRRHGHELVTEFADGRQVRSDAVLNATGRIPNTDTLAADRFDTHPDGRLVTDRRMRVLRDGQPVPGVFAIGDITSPFGLKHVANHQARIVQAQLLGEDAEDTLAPVPSATFAGPEVASFGVRSQAAPPDALVVTQEYATVAYGWALEDTTSFCRLVVSAEGEILGAHIMGPEASNLIQIPLQAAVAGRRVQGLARSMYWPHPALSEVVENALLAAEDALAQKGT